MISLWVRDDWKHAFVKAVWDKHKLPLLAGQVQTIPTTCVSGKIIANTIVVTHEIHTSNAA